MDERHQRPGHLRPPWRCREVILRLAKGKGVTFLVASHLAAEIEKMCDKVLVLYRDALL
ncbi:MAG: hypothetical protein ACLT9P_05140 [Evtepia gabavorous]